MRIHITTTAPELAAVEIMRHMEAHGGEWIVNAVEDEGYVMARVGTLCGKRLERSLSPCLVGPFSADWSLRTVISDLKAARHVGYTFKASQSGTVKPRGRPKLNGKLKPDEAMILEVLRREQLAVVPLAERLGMKSKRAADIIRNLRYRKHVIVASTEAVAGGGTPRHIYGVAA